MNVQAKKKPADFRHLAAWGRMLGSHPSYVREEQEAAARADAPLDAIYYREREGWARYSEVTEPRTRAAIERMLEA